MYFRYRAISESGQVIRGELPARHPEELASKLYSQGLTLLTHRQVHAQANAPLSRRELINFCFHLEQLCRAGIGLHDALKDLYGSLTQGALQRITGNLVAELESGRTLSEALADFPGTFSPSQVSLVRAAELSGQLPEILERLGKALKAEDELAAQTRKLLMYPMFAGSVVLATGLFLINTLVPQLQGLLRQTGHTWPWHANLLFTCADFLKNNGSWLAVAAFLAGVLLYFARFFPQYHRQIRILHSTLPLIGPLHKKSQLARIAATLALLYGAGIPLLQALANCRSSTDHPLLAESLANVESAISNGSSLADAFAQTGLFPPLVVRMLRIGESTGRLELSLANVDYFYQREIRETVDKMQSLIEPSLTLLLGGLLAWIMSAILGPIYDIVGSVRP